MECYLAPATHHHVYCWASPLNAFASRGRRAGSSYHSGFLQISSVEAKSTKSHHTRGRSHHRPRICSTFNFGQARVSSSIAGRASPACSLLYRRGVQQFPTACLDAKVCLTGGPCWTGMADSSQTGSLRCWIFSKVYPRPDTQPL